MSRVPDNLEHLTDKQLAEMCDCFEPAGTFKDDKSEPTCLAHLAEARVWSCSVFLGKAHIKSENLRGRCADWQLKKDEGRKAK